MGLHAAIYGRVLRQRKWLCQEKFVTSFPQVIEHSRGSKRRLGGIAKAGNSHRRKLLVEAAWHYRNYHSNSKRLRMRRIGLDAPLVSYTNRAGRRLNKKYLHLIFKGKCSQVAATAVARELSGFIWRAMVGKVA